jgi:hypothetical protein
LIDDRIKHVQPDLENVCLIEIHEAIEDFAHPE